MERGNPGGGIWVGGWAVINGWIGPDACGGNVGGAGAVCTGLGVGNKGADCEEWVILCIAINPCCIRAICVIFCEPVQTKRGKLQLMSFNVWEPEIIPSKSEFPWSKACCIAIKGAFWANIILLTGGGAFLDAAEGDCFTASDGGPSTAGFSSTVGVGTLFSFSSRLSPPGGGGSLSSSLNSSSRPGEAGISSLNSSAC